MFKIILKTTFFYYFIAFFIIFKCVNFSLLHELRAGNVGGNAIAHGCLEKVVYYDYLTHMPFNDGAENWFKLSESYKLCGDYPNALKACKRAIRLMTTLSKRSQMDILKLTGSNSVYCENNAHD